MDKFVLIDDDWMEVVLKRNKNSQAFDSIIEQKTSNVKKILLSDYETGWMIGINSSRVILIN